MDVARCPKCRYFVKPDAHGTVPCPMNFQACPVREGVHTWSDTYPAQK